MNRCARNSLVRMTEYWGDAFPPPCACGCGEPVRFNQRGPNKYVNIKHKGWDLEANKAKGAKVAESWIDGRDPDEWITTEAFCAAVRKLARDKGVPICRMAEMGGWPKGRLNSMLYAKKPRKRISKAVAGDFLRRVAGMPAPMTAYQKRKFDERRANEVRAMNEIRNSHLRDRKR